MMKTIQIHNRFKLARLNAGLTQREVHKRIKFISYQALSQYEKDIRIPSNKVLYELPILYKVSLDYLLMQDEYRNHDEYIQDVLGLDATSITILKKIKSQNDELNELYQFIAQLDHESEVI